MATKTIIEQTSDLSGKPDAETLTFSLGSQAYEIDLTKGEQETLFKKMSEYVEHARKVRTGGTSAGTASKTRRGGASTGEDPKEVRTWLVEHGYGAEVSERGRIASHLLDAYRSRTPKAAEPETATETPAKDA